MGKELLEAQALFVEAQRQGLRAQRLNLEARAALVQAMLRVACIPKSSSPKWGSLLTLRRPGCP